MEETRGSNPLGSTMSMFEKREVPYRDSSREHLNAVLQRDWDSYIRQLTEPSAGKPPLPHIGGFLDERLLFDIQITRQRGRVRYSHRLMIKSESRAVVDYMQDNFPGVGRVTKNIGRGARKDSWLWRVTKTEDALKFLEQVEPHLTLKRSQAELLQDFLYERTQRGGSGYPLSKADIEVDRQHYEDLRVLRHEVQTRPYLPKLEVLAGMFDGGLGSVTIQEINNPINPESYWFELLLSFKTPHKGLLEGLANKYGGKGDIERYYENSLRHGGEPSYRWRIAGRAAGRILEDILPHAILKRPFVVLCLDFIKTQRALYEEFILSHRSRDTKGRFQDGQQVPIRPAILEKYIESLRSLRSTLGEE